MEKVEGGIIKVFANEDRELEGIFFQDLLMRQYFARFPDFLLFDATYKLNDRRMPLAIMMVVDNHGESQIAGVFILKTENGQYLVELLTYFKTVNNKHDKIETIMCDKSLVNLNAFATALPNAQVVLCMFHVLQIFKREITPKKRHFPKESQTEIFKIINAMVYGDTEESYMQQYEKLKSLNFEGNYFNVIT